MKSNQWRERCEKQLEQTLSTFANLTGYFCSSHDWFISFLSTDLIRLTLTIESKSSENNLKSYRLIIDEQETSMSMPTLVKEFPLEVS